MATYCVYLPPADGGERGSTLERMRLMRDGFHWSAFLFGPLWFLARRLWLGAFALLALELLLGFAAVLIGVGGLPALLAGVAWRLFVGFEASSVERWTLDRRDWRWVDVVVSPRRDEAERRVVERLVAGQAAAPLARSGAGPRSPAAPATPTVLGLFPEPARP